MRIEITKEWCLKMAQIEGSAEIGAGLHALDPIFDGEMMPKDNRKQDTSIAFGRFVQLMRREKGLTLEKLAEDTDLEISELVEIEEDSRHKPELRTVYQLANYFRVPRGNLLQVAGLTQARNDNLAHEAVRFAARSESVAVLTAEERKALEEFVGILTKQ
jgi:transcriptional regulator with XRE-family HTH domain